MPEEPRPYTCWDLKDIEGFPGCCESCHEDEEDYNYALNGDGIMWWVCCKVAVWLESRGVDLTEGLDGQRSIKNADWYERYDAYSRNRSAPVS